MMPLLPMPNLTSSAGGYVEYLSSIRPWMLLALCTVPALQGPSAATLPRMLPALCIVPALLGPGLSAAISILLWMLPALLVLLALQGPAVLPQIGHRMTMIRAASLPHRSGRILL